MLLTINTPADIDNLVTKQTVIIDSDSTVAVMMEAAEQYGGIVGSVARPDNYVVILFGDGAVGVYIQAPDL